MFVSVFFFVNNRNLKPAFLRTDQQKSVDRNFIIIKKCALITFATFSALHQTGSSLSNIYQRAHDRAEALEDNLESNLGKRFSAMLKKFFRYQIPCVYQIADGNFCFAENIINSLTLITE